MKYAHLIGFSMAVGVALMGWASQSQARDRSDGLNAADVSITATYMVRAPEEPEGYKIGAQWPVSYLSQWTKVLKTLDLTKEAEIMHNPVAEKDDSVIAIVQKNPDQISGEDVYFSEKGYILRIIRSPVDQYYERTQELYDFLLLERKFNKVNYISASAPDKTDSAPIVVLYRESQTLGNPVWEVTDPEKIALYQTLVSSLQPIAKIKNLKNSLQANDEDFNDMNNFLVYLNYEDAPTKLLMVNKYGYARSSRVNSVMRCYPDKENFYNIFKIKAEEVIQNAKEIEERRKQGSREKRF